MELTLTFLKIRQMNGADRKSVGRNIIFGMSDLCAVGGHGLTKKIRLTDSSTSGIFLPMWKGASSSRSFTIWSPLHRWTAAWTGKRLALTTLGSMGGMLTSNLPPTFVPLQDFRPFLEAKLHLKIVCSCQIVQEIIMSSRKLQPKTIAT